MLRFLILFLSLVSCGTEDQQRQKCFLYGDDCSEDVIIEGPEGEPGHDGKDGQDGNNGVNGADGSDGSNGVDGRDGLDGSVITEVLLCPEKPGTYPEVLLCIDNKLYAVYDGGPQKDRLVLLSPGNYITTDGRQCHFTVIENCQINY